MTVCISAVIFFYFQKTKLNDRLTSIDKIVSSYDIINPKFTISNINSKIEVKADEGDFINNEEILLKNNVKFESSDFTILSSEVFFDKRNQSAYSKNKSQFISTGANINAKGFEIMDKGNKILFNGKTTIVLENK